MTAPVRLLQPLEPGCVLYLPFWEGAGAVAADISPYGNNGGITGATWADGVLGKCLNFNGASDYINCGKNASLEFGTGDFTLEAWIKADTFPVIGNIFHKGGGSAEAGYQLRLVAPNNIQVVICDGTAIRPNIAVTGKVVDTWYHVVAVLSRASDTLKLYCNAGTPASVSTTGLGSITNTALNLILGSAAGTSSWYDGLIDEAMIYNWALSASEVFEHYYRSARYAG